MKCFLIFYIVLLLFMGITSCSPENVAGDGLDKALGEGKVSEDIENLYESIDAIQLSAGVEHTCAVMRNGTVTCWGASYKGSIGIEESEANREGYMLSGTAVNGLTTVVNSASSHWATCVVLSGGSAKCWGNNQTDENSTVPYTPVSITGISKAIQVSVSYSTVCALLNDGTIKHWKWIDYSSESTTPELVADISDAIQVTCGLGHKCALLNNGKVMCWGNNLKGNLGDGTGVLSVTPVAVSDISSATQITASEDFSCALLANGTIECWGGGVRGRLGNGSTADQLSPVPVTGISTATKLAESDVYTETQHMCAVLEDGSVKCWGRGDYGQLGTGDLEDQSTPATVQGISNATNVAVGSFHTCAILQEGKVFCWGRGEFGQLGYGGRNDKTNPVEAIIFE